MDFVSLIECYSKKLYERLCYIKFYAHCNNISIFLKGAYNSKLKRHKKIDFDIKQGI